MNDYNFFSVSMKVEPAVLHHKLQTTSRNPPCCPTDLAKLQKQQQQRLTNASCFFRETNWLRLPFGDDVAT